MTELSHNWTKYFVAIFAALVALTIAVLFVGHQLIASGNARDIRIQEIMHNQECISRAQDATPPQARAIYVACQKELN